MTHTSKTRQFQLYTSPLGSFAEAGALGLLVALFYFGLVFWSRGPDDTYVCACGKKWRAVDVLGPDTVPTRGQRLTVRGDAFSLADVRGTLPISADLAASIRESLDSERLLLDSPVVLTVDLDRDTRIAELAVAFDAAWRAGMDQGAFLVRKTLGYSILFAQKVAAIRFPLTEDLGRRITQPIVLGRDELRSPCGILEVMHDEEIDPGASLDRLARAMVRCRARFPHI